MLLFQKHIISSQKIVLTLIVFLFPLHAIQAQEQIRVETRAPDKIEVGQEFKLAFTINRIANDVILDTSSNNFKLISGPIRSSQNSIMINNSKKTQTEKVTFQYILTAEKTGSFQLPQATILLGQVKYYSDVQTIKVIERDTSIKYLEKDTIIIFTKLTLPDQQVHKYEPFQVQLKIYSNRMINSINGFEERINDVFLFYELNKSLTPKLKLENYNGGTLYSVILKDYIFVPTKAGNLSLGNFTIDCLLSNTKANASSTERIFQSAQTKKVKIHSDSLSVVVQNYPKRLPDDFTYISGKDIKISVALNQFEVSRNEPFEYQLKVSGAGNLNMLSSPKISFPENIHLIKTEHKNNLKLDSLGFHGDRTFTYRLFSDEKGKYEIPPFSISYFNVEDLQFQQVSSPPVIVEIINKDAKSTVPMTQPHFTQNKQIKYASLIILDLSRSMLAEDFKPNRKAAVTKEVSNYISETNQNTGLIVYSRIPQLIVPIINNKQSVIDSIHLVDSVNLGDGTSTGMAICMGLDEIQKTGATYKNIILITDGVQNYGPINENLAVQLSKNLNIPIDVIGIGGEGKNALITIKNQLGNEQRITIPIEINDEKMKKLAEQTGGKYFRATDNKTLRFSLQQIEKTVAENYNNQETPNESFFSESEVQHIVNSIKQYILLEKEKLEK